MRDQRAAGHPRGRGRHRMEAGLGVEMKAVSMAARATGRQQPGGGLVIGPLPAKFLLLWSTKPSSPSYFLVSQFHDTASQLSTVEELVSPDFGFPFYEIREQVQSTSMISLSSKNF